MIKKGDAHYHCFGCSAHGDAIAFLMDYAKMSFLEAVESLAEKFSVPLEKTESNYKGPSKAKLKEVLQEAARFYHFNLLHTKEGHQALEYLYNRGMDLNFIKTFQIGLSSSYVPLRKYLYDKKFSKDDLVQTGLLKGDNDFFISRVMIPIRDSLGAVIGFSGRSYLEKTFGPKYVNSPETYLFKKSRVLFGLSFSRKKILQEKKVIIVEGQFDALFLIHNGFDITVAGQGTAFGKDHVQILLQLGVVKVYLALDGDKAGQEASIKIGDLFQSEGMEVFVVDLPKTMDPDTFLKEHGPQAFATSLEKSCEYLPYIVEKLSIGVDLDSPAQKNKLVLSIAERIRKWEHPLMVHESLRKLAKLTHTPESLIGIGKRVKTPQIIKKSQRLIHSEIDPDRVLETDLLRWLFIMGEKRKDLIELAALNIQQSDFKISVCKELYKKYMDAAKDQKPLDLLSLAIDLADAEKQLFLSEMLQKRINKERIDEQYIETIKKILERNWMEEKEMIKTEIFNQSASEEESLILAKRFNELQKNRPEVKHIEKSDFLET